MRLCFFLFQCCRVTMGNCYCVPRRGGSRKDVTTAYRPSNAYSKSELTSVNVSSHPPSTTHNAFMSSANRRAVSSSTSLQHISEREPDGELLLTVSLSLRFFLRTNWLGRFTHLFPEFPHHVHIMCQSLHSVFSI